MTINYKKLSEKAVQPVRTTTSGAGYNLVAANVTTEVNERGQLILVYHTDLAIEVPTGYEAYLRPAETLAAKTLRMIDAPRAIDGNMDTEVIVRYITTTDVVPAVYKEGDIIAQLVFNKIEDAEFIENVEPVEDEQSAVEGDQDAPESAENAEATSGGEANVPEEA